jgi:hypothetical protein
VVVEDGTAGAFVDDEGAAGAVGLCAAELDDEDDAGLLEPPRVTVIDTAADGSRNPLSLWNVFASNFSPSPGIFKLWTAFRPVLLYMRNVNFLSPVSPSLPGALYWRSGCVALSIWVLSECLKLERKKFSLRLLSSVVSTIRTVKRAVVLMPSASPRANVGSLATSTSRQFKLVKVGKVWRISRSFVNLLPSLKPSLASPVYDTCNVRSNVDPKSEGTCAAASPSTEAAKAAREKKVDRIVNAV